MIKAHIYGYNEALADKTNIHCYLGAVPKAGDAYFDAEGEFKILAVGYEAGKESIRVYIEKDLPKPTPEQLEQQAVWREAAAKAEARKNKWYRKYRPQIISWVVGYVLGGSLVVIGALILRNI